MGKAYDYAGKTIEHLKVLHRAPNRNTRQSWWTCQCACGNIKEIRGRKLATGDAVSCGCKQYENRTNTWQWKGHGQISGRYWAIVQKSAKNRKIDFNLSIEDAWGVFEAQKGICALSGVKIELQRDHRRKNQTASIDRIHSHLGYTKDNIQWVHAEVNNIKTDMGQDVFIEWCKKIAAHNN